MGPPLEVHENFEDPTRTKRMDKKKQFLMKYNLSHLNASKRKSDAQMSSELQLNAEFNQNHIWPASDALREENRIDMSMDTLNLSDGRASPNREVCGSSPYHFLKNSSMKHESMDSQYHTSMPHFIKQEALDHQLGLTPRPLAPCKTESSTYQATDGDYNSFNFNNIPIGSLNLSSDNSYYSSVRQTDRDPSRDHGDYAPNDFNNYFKSNGYYASEQLPHSDPEEYKLHPHFDDHEEYHPHLHFDEHEEFHERGRRRDQSHNSFNEFQGSELPSPDHYLREREMLGFKSDPFQLLEGGDYASYDEDQPLDLTMRKSCSPPSHSGLEDEEEILSKPASEAGSPYFPDEETDDEFKMLLRKIKTGTRSRVRSPKSWEFLLRMLLEEKFNPKFIRWEDKYNGTFRLVRKDEIAKIWGTRSVKHKDGGLTYDNFARNLRYHYKTKMLLPVSEKHLVYKFGEEIMDQLRKTGTYLYL